MLTLSRGGSACAFRNAAVKARALAFSPVATASSRSISAMSALLAAALVIFFSLSPGANSQERALNISVAWVIVVLLIAWFRLRDAALNRHCVEIGRASCWARVCQYV